MSSSKNKGIVTKPSVLSRYDRMAKQILKDKERFKSFIHFVAHPDQYHFIDFNHFTVLESEFFQKNLKGYFQARRGDILIKVGLKDTLFDGLVGICMEHKSHGDSQKHLYLQGLRDNVALLEAGIYPIMNIFILHGEAPKNIGFDLQEAFCWTEKMRRCFGNSALNFIPDVIDLRKVSDADIEKAKLISAFCYTFKNTKNMTPEHLRSMFHLCFRESKDIASYHDYISILAQYLLQDPHHSVESLYQIESEVITNEEDRGMQTAYDKIIAEGLAQGMEKGLTQGMEKGLTQGMEKGLTQGRQEGLEEGLEEGKQSIILNMLKMKMDIATITKCTGTSKERILELQSKIKT